MNLSKNNWYWFTRGPFGPQLRLTGFPRTYYPVDWVEQYQEYEDNR